MKKAILTISALMISAMISTGAFATVPDLIPVQGVLADSADLPIDALTDITFTLYDGDGTLLVSLGGTGSEPGRFSFPAGIAAHPDGRVVVADSLNRRLQIFSPVDAGASRLE